MSAFEQANRRINDLCGVKKTETRNIFKNTTMKNLTFDEAYDILIGLDVSEETINTVCNINGRTFEQLESILYATQGYNCFSQLNDDDE